MPVASAPDLAPHEPSGARGFVLALLFAFALITACLALVPSLNLTNHFVRRASIPLLARRTELMALALGSIGLVTIFQVIL